MNRFYFQCHSLVRATVLFLALMAVSAMGALAQSTTSGTITGVVTDPQGAVIPGTTITATDVLSKATFTTVSNGDGQYILPNVPPATYDITAVKSGFSKDEIKAALVSVGTQTTGNFKMAIGAENTVVEVTSSNADLQTMNASTAEIVDPAVVDSLPAINRDASQFSAFMPGVTPSGNVAGTVQDQAVFQLDGGDNSSDMDGSMESYTGSNGGSSTGGFLAASSSGVMPMPQDSVEEVRVSTSGQTADFNNSSGMQSSIVTKRGHDKWHGTVYEYYLDNNFNANTWGNNFPNACFSNAAPTTSCPSPIATSGLAGSTSYVPKPSYHYSRFGAAAGGKVLGHFLGGNTYLFANYEGFRYPLAVTYERTVPSYQFLQGQLTFTAATQAASTANFPNCTWNGATLGTTTCTKGQLMGSDPRGIGISPILQQFYNSELPVAPASNSGNVGANGTTYNGVFDSSCGALSSSYCDQMNTIGYKGNVATPVTSNFFVTRIDHDFGQKWHFMASFRYYKYVTTTSNQVDIGGGFSGDTVGSIKATAPRPQDPVYFVTGLTTNISSSLTNDFHASFLRNFWQWKNNGDAPQQSTWGGAVEPFGESSATTVLAPYNVNAQNTRTRIWDGKDTFFRDDVTKLKGDHLLQGGGSFEYKNIYHQRTDNGNSINYSTTYQIGDSSGGGVVTYQGAPSTCATTPGLNCVGANSSTTNARILDAYYGIVTDTQGANTYTNSGGSLTLNPPRTAFSANPRVPFYNIYATDTWHALPSLTINYGLSYAIEMPPNEPNGNQVMFTDAAGNAVHTQQYLAAKAASSLAGTVYNPEAGFALIKNVLNAPGGGKYPYNPYYAGVSPRISLAWNPKFKDPGLDKIFGGGATVIRGGYSRIYGRINGDIQTLNPMLSPGLVLATQCRYAQSAATGTGACTNNGSLFNDNTAFRFGTVDGTTAPIATPPTNLATPVYHPGYDGPGVAIASPVDPEYKPNYVDTFNVSIQRQINRKMLVEVGYIGRIIKNELETLNPNSVPYMLSEGGQTFEAAYVALEASLGCTTSASLCNTSAAPTASTPVTKQPFFENSLSSAYCQLTVYASCTQAVLVKQASNLRTQKIYSLWSALDNNSNGVAVPGFTFGRSLMGTPVTSTVNPTYGTSGQLVTGLSVATSAGYGNYNGGYVSFKVTSWHGLTLQENLTYSKSLGLDDSAQSSSGLTANDSYNLGTSYGVESYNQKYIFNTFLVYQSPFYKDQRGIIGRLAGGWTLSPVVTAGTGQPLGCSTADGSQAFGGGDGNNFTNNEQCVFTTPYKGALRTQRGITGGVDPNGVKVGTAVHPGSSAAAINIFSNPVAVYDTVRPPILGLDDKYDGGEGPMTGLGYVNLDLSVKKDITVFESFKLELTGVMLNVLNHNDFANPTNSTTSSSSTSFGVVKAQGNTPRQIQMGVRANF